MIYLQLKGTNTVHCQQESFLIIQYFIVKSFFHHKPIYGIQIQSHYNDNFSTIHSETIKHITYSYHYVNEIIRLCIDYFVTPTDLFSSLDILMDAVAE